MLILISVTVNKVNVTRKKVVTTTLKILSNKDHTGLVLEMLQQCRVLFLLGQLVLPSALPVSFVLDPQTLTVFSYKSQTIPQAALSRLMCLQLTQQNARNGLKKLCQTCKD